MRLMGGLNHLARLCLRPMSHAPTLVMPGLIRHPCSWIPPGFPFPTGLRMTFLRGN